jgi:sulfopyruvate decarboxylase alpha subunit
MTRQQDARVGRAPSPASTKAGKGTADWPERIHAVLSACNVRQVPYVPDSGHARLIELCHADRNMRAVPLTTEEEGVALLAGAWLAGDRGALLMQSSGSGNCINMLGMIVECRFPLLMLITMRGQWGEFNPWQLPMAQATLPALNAIGAVVQSVDEAGKVEETVSAAARLAFNTFRPVAVLISQRIVGAKEFK